jgi:Ca2+-binding EF-hand superfamily protein
MCKVLIAIAVGAIMLSTGAAAHRHAPVRASGVHQQPELTREQALAQADQLFDMFDLNHDGVISRAEAQKLGRKLMRARMETGTDMAPGLGGHTLHFLEERFATETQVTRPELESAMLAHFDQMDVNHDGILTTAEREEANAQLARR